MSGNEQVRYCSECKLNVYNFSAMTTKEINQLVAASGGRVCARFYQRSDGTMLTQDCPTGFRAAIWRNSKAATLLLSAMFGSLPAFAKPFPQNQTALTQIRPADNQSLRVSDVTGARISHAQVTLRDVTNGQSLLAQTDDQGQLSTIALPHGTYDISVVVLGFPTLRLLAVELPLTKPLDVQLQIALMGEVICVPHRNSAQKVIDRVKRFFS